MNNRYRPGWILLFCFLAFGCAEVKPWQRGNLAKPHMALEPDPTERIIRDHTFYSKEASTGGAGVGGGGCGCN